MKVTSLIEVIGADFFAGVPDSQLRALCDYLIDKYGIDPKHHIIAANEGNAVALAAGYHFATGKIPVVYMQNSGEGNVINPVASLMNDKVYAIPCVFIIGWRGEPGIHDEPQHIYQGEVTLKLLEVMNIVYYVISKEATEDELSAKMKEFKGLLSQGRQVAFVIKKGALTFDGKVVYENENLMTREDIIRQIVQFTGDDPIVSTTGKASRELFEIRMQNGQGHERDFLTVGSMGHASSIALGIALQKPEKKIWIIDGDGAVLMHMGAMATIGAFRPDRVVHIVLNNGAHESVGGMPTVAEKIDLVGIAKACGYANAVSVNNMDGLAAELKAAQQRTALSFIEVKCSIGTRADLGRPTSTAEENKEMFVEHLRND